MDLLVGNGEPGQQGVGVGGLPSLVQITMAAMIPPRERGRYVGYTSSAAGRS